MPSLHPFAVLFDRIASLPLTPPEKAVLWTIARHSDWATGTGSFAHHRRLAAEAGLGLSTVRRVLAGLACTAGVSGTCLGHASRCLHRGLLDIEWSADGLTWALHLDRFAPRGQDRQRAYHRAPEYEVLRGARQRCEDRSRRGYANYGGRGIEYRLPDALVEATAALIAEIGPRPSPMHSLDRIDNDGHYELGNLRWATPSEQSRNQRPRGLR